MKRPSKDVLNYLTCQGVCSAGIATVETLEGGRPLLISPEYWTPPDPLMSN